MDNSPWLGLLVRVFKIFSSLSTALLLPEDLQSAFQGIKQILLPSCGTICLVAAYRQYAQLVADTVAGSKLPVELVDMITEFIVDRELCLAIATLAAQQNVRGLILAQFGTAWYAELDELCRLIKLREEAD